MSRTCLNLYLSLSLHYCPIRGFVFLRRSWCWLFDGTKRACREKINSILSAWCNADEVKTFTENSDQGSEQQPRGYICPINIRSYWIHISLKAALRRPAQSHTKLAVHVTKITRTSPSGISNRRDWQLSCDSNNGSRRVAETCQCLLLYVEI